MKKDDTYYFGLLKKEVSATFSSRQKVYTPIKEWKGDEITLFQEDLSATVGTSISEKWFYTYFKNELDKLPRVDMLNLLSEYAGYSNWSTFKGKHQQGINSNRRVKKMGFLVFGLVALTLALVYPWRGQNNFQFCFVDQLTDEAILQIPLDIKVLNENESPETFKTDSLGCFTYRTRKEYIQFVIQSPYHKTDTVLRFIDTRANELVEVERDDYALMLHYYTSGNVKDWQAHKTKLEQLISEDALIYQIHSNIGVEVYTKEDFIQKLTVPTSELKRIKILEKRMQDGKIITLKFAVL
nr:hypothetical protein [Allomuricauda sp.]